MKTDNTFYKTVWNIAFPVTLQSLLQSSFSVIDQIMTGQLGSVSIAGIGLGGKFSSIFSVMVSAVAVAAGIMIAQYMGKKDMEGVSRSFFVNLIVAVSLAAFFTVISAAFPSQIMGIYTKDQDTGMTAAGYLKIMAVSYIPIAVNTLFAVLLRCMEAALYPLYASILAAVLNTGLNYLLIFGKCGFPRMGVNGAAWATVSAQIFGCIVTFILFLRHYKKQDMRMRFVWRLGREKGIQYLGILLPLLICEFLWSLGENVYAAIYGRIGTQPCAAMTLTAPVQGLIIGALSGLSQAAGIITGKSLGSRAFDRAYREAKKLMLYGLIGSAALSLLLLAASPYYVRIYQVEPSVRDTAVKILIAYAVISPVKVQNMILGGGIVRSGGKTKYIMWIDFIGTWFFGVPLGMLAAFVWKMQIPWVYFILSLEECVRLGITLVVFRRKKWMESI